MASAKRSSRELVKELNPDSIFERIDPRSPGTGDRFQPAHRAFSMERRTSTTFAMNSVQFHFDAVEGQKTGAFLDQRENYAAAAATPTEKRSTFSAIKAASRSTSRKSARR